MFDWVSLLEAGHKIAGVDTGAASDGDLLEAAVAVEQLRTSLDACQAKTTAELRHRAVCEREFGLSAGGWLAHAAQLPVGATKKRAAVAAKLAVTLTVTLDAVVEGRVSWDHARVLADACNPRIADEFALLQGELIELAQGYQFDRWRREVEAIARLLDQDGGHDPTQDQASNSLRLSRTFEGLGILDATFTPENAASLEAMLNTKA